MANPIRRRPWLAKLGLLTAFVVVLVSSKAMFARPTQSPTGHATARRRVLHAEASPLTAVELPRRTTAEPSPPVAMPADQDLAPVGPPAGPEKSSITQDPEGSAGEFLDRTRREATEAVQALSAEAESLRARLARTEAGLKRWQGVLGALDAQVPGSGRQNPAEPANPTSVSPVPPSDEAPRASEPVAPAPASPESLPPKIPAEQTGLPKAAG